MSVLRADWAALLNGTDRPVHVVQETSATSEFGVAIEKWLPLAKASVLDSPEGEGMAEPVLVAAPLESDRTVLVVGRRSGPVFLGSEVARLSYLANLAVAIRAGAR